METTDTIINGGGAQAVPDPAPLVPLPATQMAHARAVQENCLQAMARALTAELDCPVSAELVDTTFLPGSEIAGEGACRLTLKLEPLGGQAFVIVDATMMSQLLRLLLKAPDRAGVAVTEIELHVLREAFDILVRELAAAWASPHVQMRWTATNGPLPDGEPLLVFDARLNFGGSEAGLRFAVPVLVARLLAMQVGEGVKENPAAVRSSLLTSLREACVEAEAVLAGPSLRMSDLLALEPGQVLVLGEAAGSQLECRINGKTVFRGDWIHQGNQGALQIQ